MKFDQCRHRYTAYQISNWNKQQQPDYILTLIRFNKSQISGSQEGIIYTFIIIAQLAKPQFTGQNLAMLFIAAKRYNLKYSDWKHKEQIIWNLLLRFASILDPQGISNVLIGLNSMKRRFFQVMDPSGKHYLLNTVKQNVAQFNSENIANTLLALDQMGLKWVDLESRLQTGLLTSVKHNI